MAAASPDLFATTCKALESPIPELTQPTDRPARFPRRSLRKQHGLELSTENNGAKYQCAAFFCLQSCAWLPCQCQYDLPPDASPAIVNVETSHSASCAPRCLSVPPINRSVAPTGSCVAEAQSGLRGDAWSVEECVWMVRLRAAELRWAYVTREPEWLESGEAGGRCLSGVVGRQFDESTSLCICLGSVLDSNRKRKHRRPRSAQTWPRNSVAICPSPLMGCPPYSPPVAAAGSATLVLNGHAAPPGLFFFGPVASRHLRPLAVLVAQAIWIRELLANHIPPSRKVLGCLGVGGVGARSRAVLPHADGSQWPGREPVLDAGWLRRPAPRWPPNTILLARLLANLSMTAANLPTKAKMCVA
ncbi:hypothetical protein B0H67DRAFT_257839 [Lasiosphaeris hirsuta]|uniref:Uncharacterized protein n=1 Tax=Lasiosphaeris hirsuta TaxID=260670 RepID=A0AA40DYD7_9PEZI|nr:hypothetical protein B0H67DRAFT_257839 [Lasiosphaeris hirsuta]